LDTSASPAILALADPGALFRAGRLWLVFDFQAGFRAMFLRTFQILVPILCFCSGCADGSLLGDGGGRAPLTFPEGFLFGAATGMAMTGFWSDRLGLRGCYFASLLLFVLASGSCGLVSGELQMVPLRLLAGYGTGLVISSAMVLIWREFPTDKELAMAIYGIGLYLAAVVGSSLGGFILLPKAKTLSLQQIQEEIRKRTIPVEKKIAYIKGLAVGSEAGEELIKELELLERAIDEISK